MQRAKLFAYLNNNIVIKRILQDKQFHLQLKSEQKEIIQNVLEKKDSMASEWLTSPLFAHKLSSGNQFRIHGRSIKRDVILVRFVEK
jgi:hypothetical protein